MINTWTLPKTARIGGIEYAINADFRDILEIIAYLTDESRPIYMRWMIATGLFYDGDIPPENLQEAMEYIADFISYGESGAKPGPKLLDWEQDAQLIISDVNKVAGTEIRAIPYLHWWTFLSYFHGIGEGQLSTIVSIRNKKMHGKKLEKWEQDYYRENKSKIDFQSKKTEADKATLDYFNKWL